MSKVAATAHIFAKGGRREISRAPRSANRNNSRSRLRTWESLPQPRSWWRPAGKFATCKGATAANVITARKAVTYSRARRAQNNIIPNRVFGARKYSRGSIPGLAAGVGRLP